MSSIIWVIALVVLQAVIAGLAKKAQEKKALEKKALEQKNARLQQGQRPAAPAAPATPAARGSPTQRTVVRAQPAATPVKAPPVQRPQVAAPSVTPVMSVESERENARAKKEADARARALAQARAQAEAQARAQREAAARDREHRKALADARARAEHPREAAQRAAASHLKPLKPSSTQRTVTSDREEYAAMHSRERVEASLRKVRAAEQKVDDALPGEPSVSRAGGRSPQAMSPVGASIREALRNPQRIREAFVIAEVLGAPPSMPNQRRNPIGVL